MNRFDKITGWRGNAAEELLTAFIFCGWEKVLPLKEAIEIADFLAWDDPIRAKELSGQLVRGEPMTREVAVWVGSARENALPNANASSQ